MKDFQSVLGRAAGDALCNVLGTYGSAAPLLTAFSLIEPTPIGEVAAVTSGLAALAAQAGCTWDTEGPAPPGGTGYEGCEKLSVGVARMMGRRQNQDHDAYFFQYIEIKRFYTKFEHGKEWDYFDYIDIDGVFQTERQDATHTGTSYYSILEPGAVCEIPSPGVTPPDPDPHTYEDEETGCSLTVNFKGWGINHVGGANGVWEIAPAADQLRADGGIIGGCNFNPVIYVDDGGGGGGGGGGGYLPPYAPVPPGGPLSPEQLQELVREIVSGAIGAGIARALDELFDTPYSGITYRLVSVCETDESGEPISKAVEEEIPDLKFNDAVLTRLDALVPLLQGQKDFKQPVCPPSKLYGEFRTIGFISENHSPNGRDYLRKRLRYRSLSGIGLNDLINHWKDFRFDAGPVIVKHRGSSWGTVTCWAATAFEGKRVIRHAASEARIDVDQTGRWEISGSTSSRLGMPGKMRVNTTGGFYWITARDGSSERPMVGAL